MAATASFRTHGDHHDTEDGEILPHSRYDERERNETARRRRPLESSGNQHGRKRPRSPQTRSNVEGDYRPGPYAYHDNNNGKDWRHSQEVYFKHRQTGSRGERFYADRTAPGVQEAYESKSPKIQESWNQPSSRRIDYYRNDTREHFSTHKSSEGRSQKLDRSAVEHVTKVDRSYRGDGYRGELRDSSREHSVKASNSRNQSDDSRHFRSSRSKHSRERPSSPDRNSRLLYRSNDEGMSRGRAHDSSRGRFECGERRQSNVSSPRMPSSSPSLRIRSEPQSELGDSPRHKDWSDHSRSRQSSFSGQARTNAPVREHISASVDSRNSRQLHYRERSDNSRRERSLSRERCNWAWESGASVTNAPRHRNSIGSSTSGSTAKDLVYLKETVAPLNCRHQDRREKISDYPGESERVQTLQNAKLEVTTRRNSCCSASSRSVNDPSGHSRLEGRFIPATLALTPQFSRSTVGLCENTIHSSTQGLQSESLMRLEPPPNSNILPIRPVLPNALLRNEGQPALELSRNQLSCVRTSSASLKQLSKVTDDAAKNTIEAVNDLPKTLLQPTSPASTSCGKLSLPSSLCIPSRWLKPKVIKATKEPITVKVAIKDAATAQLHSIPRRNVHQQPDAVLKTDPKDMKESTGRNKDDSKEEERSLQVAERKMEKAPITLVSTAHNHKRSKGTREEPGATPDLLDASFSSPARPLEEKIESNPPTIVSEDDGIMIESPQQYHHQVQLSLGERKISSCRLSCGQTEQKSHNRAIYNRHDSSSADEACSSDDSDTDEDELMEWAHKMFGVPPHLPETTSRNLFKGTGLHSAHVKPLKLKIRLPNAKQKIYRESSPSNVRRVKISREETSSHLHSDSSAVISMQMCDEAARLAAEENRRKKEFAKPLTAAEVEAILADDDAAAPPSTWVRRSTRQPSRSVLTSPTVRSLLEKLKSNDRDMVVLKMKKYLSDPDAAPAALDVILDALEENTNCEALYIQNFNQGMRDKQVLHLLKILQLPTCRIWCLNIGETYNVSTETWAKFASGLSDTKVTHMYASEHTISTELKDEIRETIRLNRSKHDMHCNPSNLDTIILCTHCWWNPINTKALRPYLRNRGFEHMLNDPEHQGLRGSTSGAPA